VAQSIKLGDDIMKIVRRESELQSRSIASQIAHWARIVRISVIVSVEFTRW
jgi:hypothetical protein